VPRRFEGIPNHRTEAVRLRLARQKDPASSSTALKRLGMWRCYSLSWIWPASPRSFLYPLGEMQAGMWNRSVCEIIALA